MSKETKCNCQYEEGHSFECPLYRPTPNPLEEPKESFEERTAKKLDNDILSKISEEPKEWEEWTIDSNSPTEKEFKQFISQVESKAYNKGFKDGEDYANDMEHSGKSNIIKP